MNASIRSVIGALCVSAALVGCQSTDQTPAAELSSVSLVNPDTVFMSDSQVISWSFAGEPVPVDLYWAEQPDTNRMKPLAEAVTGNSYRVPELAGARRYVYVDPQNGEGHWVAERVLPLAGGHNFRDLGGYQTREGRRVQWGKLYRSGTMVGLTEADYDYLGQLDIRVMCDFRSREERAGEPTDWRAFTDGADYLTEDYSMRDLMSREDGLAFTQIKTADDARAMFKSFYRSGPYTFKDQYARMFDELAAGNAPLAFNCSAGKDRTGMAAALILSALDVPRDTIVADYALTEKVVDHEAQAHRGKRKKAQDEDAPHSGVAAMPAEARRVLMGSDPMFIRAMFTELEKNHGSVDAYLREELAVTESELASLRSRYLTD